MSRAAITSFKETAIKLCELRELNPDTISTCNLEYQGETREPNWVILAWEIRALLEVLEVCDLIEPAAHGGWAPTGRTPR